MSALGQQPTSHASELLRDSEMVPAISTGVPRVDAAQEMAFLLEPYGQLVDRLMMPMSRPGATDTDHRRPSERIVASSMPEARRCL